MKKYIRHGFKYLRKRFRVLEKMTNTAHLFRKINFGWKIILYMAIKDRNGGVSWNEWEEPLKNKESQAIENAKAELSRQIAFYKFQQYEFDRQWKRLRSYANENGIEIIGDIPIYVAFDSADTWSAPEMFRFNDALEPIDVAGCPPDGFSQTGQLWGNPLYDWEYHKKTGYDWWIRRIEHCFRLYDVVRIDHFRGFDEYYAVPYGEKTAVHGKWMPGPGIELFRTLEEKIGRKKDYCRRSRLFNSECDTAFKRKWISGDESASVCIRFKGRFKLSPAYIYKKLRCIYGNSR